MTSNANSEDVEHGSICRSQAAGCKALLRPRLRASIQRAGKVASTGPRARQTRAGAAAERGS